jgi:hypothetical protein
LNGQSAAPRPRHSKQFVGTRIQLAVCLPLPAQLAAVVLEVRSATRPSVKREPHALSRRRIAKVEGSALSECGPNLVPRLLPHG